MRVTGESRYMCCQNGLAKETQKPWFRLKFLDIDAAEIFALYTDEVHFQAMSACPKNTPVVLTMDLVPGRQYVTLVSVEIIKK